MSGLREPERPLAFLGSRTALAVVVCAAIVLRFATLGQQSFWDDEGYTVRLMHQSLLGLFHGVGQTESTPPTYYLLAWMWTHLFGAREFGLRSLSALAGVGTVAMCYCIASLLWSRTAGVVAAAAAAANPLLIWYSQEARAYALFAFFASVALFFFVRALQTPEPVRDLWFWGLAAAATVATHYFSMFLLVPQAVVLTWANRRRLGRLVGPFAVVLVTVAAVLPLAVEQRDKRFGFASSPLPRRVAQIPEQFLVGYGVWASPWGKLGAAVSAACALVGIVLALRARPAPRPSALTLLGIALAALALPIVYAAVGSDYVLTLYFLAVLPLAVVVVSLGWSMSALGIGAAAVYVFVALGAEAAVVATPGFQREDIRGVASRLDHPCARRAVVVSPSTVLEAYVPHLRKLARGTSVREVDLVAMAVKEVGNRETVPRSLRRPEPAPGFTLVHRVLADRFTLFTFDSRTPRRIAPAALAKSRLGPWPPARATVFLQTCGRM
jgi:uncharacterized membrane protein